MTEKVDFFEKVMLVFSLPCCIVDIYIYIFFQNKMSVSNVKKIFEDKLKTRLNKLIDVNNYLDGCGSYGLPCLLHKGTTCTRSSQAEVLERCKISDVFRERIKPKVVWMKREKDKEKDMSSWTRSLETLVEKVNNQRDPGLQQLVELMDKKRSNEEKTTGVRNIA